MYDELESDRLGFTADFSSTMHSLSPTLLRQLSRMGLEDRHFPVMDEIWHEPTPMHVRNQRFEDYLRGEGVDPTGFGPFTRLAFNMHGLVPPEEWLDIMPRIFHVHAKFYDIDAEGQEPAMDIPRIVRQFVAGRLQGLPLERVGGPRLPGPRRGRPDRAGQAAARADALRHRGAVAAVPA